MMKEANTILHGQLELLSEASEKKGRTPYELCLLSGSMVSISRTLFECGATKETFAATHPTQSINQSINALPTLTTKTTRELQWAEIKEAAECGALRVGSEIRFALKNGTHTSVTVADIKDGRVCLITTDCVAERPMYENLPDKPVSWKESDLRRWANEEFVKELPDDLASIIVSRKIMQMVGGETLETDDMLWAPSATELFGRQDWTSGDDQNEAQFPIFKTEKNRVKTLNNETWWYWTRSPRVNSATSFRVVTSSGANNSNIATSSYGVCLGLCI